jgi:hypothetical protein
MINWGMKNTYAHASHSLSLSSLVLELGNTHSVIVSAGANSVILGSHAVSAYSLQVEILSYPPFCLCIFCQSM